MSLRKQVGVFLLTSGCLQWPMTLMVESQTCEEDLNKLLSEGTGMVEASHALYGRFAEACDSESGNADVCSIPETADTTLAITASYANATTLYSQFSTACTELGYHVCSANVVFQSESGPLTLEGRPVCAPPSCDVPDLEAFVGTWENPLCADGRESCTLESTTVTCEPSRTITEGICQAETDAMQANIDGTFDDLETVRELLDGRVALACAGDAFGMDSDLCEVTASPFVIHILADFDGIASDPTYTNFQTACSDAGGTVCKSSYDFVFQGSFGAFSIDMDFDMKNMPTCFPTSCTAGEAFDVIRNFTLSDVVGSDEVSTGVARAAGEQRRRALLSRNTNIPPADNRGLRILQDTTTTTVAPLPPAAGGGDASNGMDFTKLCNTDKTAEEEKYVCEFDYTFFQCDGGEPIVGASRASLTTTSVMGYAMASTSGSAFTAVRSTSMISLLVGLVIVWIGM